MDSFMTSSKSEKAKDSNKIPQLNDKFAPLVIAAQGLCGRSYISEEEITDLAINHHRSKKGKGITLQYLIEKDLAMEDKKQAEYGQDKKEMALEWLGNLELTPSTEFHQPSRRISKGNDWP